MVCKRCQECPGSHTFHLLGTTTQGYTILYTCPAKTKNFRGDDKDFVESFEEHLRELEGTPWIWIFDCQGFTAKHMLSLENTRGLVRVLYEKHEESLKGAYIVHQAWYAHLFLKILMPFLKKETRDDIHSIRGSTLETIVELEQHGIPSSLLSCLREPPS